MTNLGSALFIKALSTSSWRSKIIVPAFVVKGDTALHFSIPISVSPTPLSTTLLYYENGFNEYAWEYIHVVGEHTKMLKIAGCLNVISLTGNNIDFLFQKLRKQHLSSLLSTVLRAGDQPRT